MDQKEPTISLDRLKHAKVSVSITLLVTMFLGGYTAWASLNPVYENWHTEHVTRIAGELMAAQSTKFNAQIAQVQTTSDSTAEKLDEVSEQIQGLQISAAINIVSSFQADLDRHERNPKNTDEWRAERDRLKRQLERATAYRDCLLNSQPNCERLRGW